MACELYLNQAVSQINKQMMKLPRLSKEIARLPAVSLARLTLGSLEKRGRLKHKTGHLKQSCWVTCSENPRRAHLREHPAHKACPAQVTGLRLWCQTDLSSSLTLPPLSCEMGTGHLRQTGICKIEGVIIGLWWELNELFYMTCTKKVVVAMINMASPKDKSWIVKTWLTRGECLCRTFISAFHASTEGDIQGHIPKRAGSVSLLHKTSEQQSPDGKFSQDTSAHWKT